jgi:gliding motility-associated-like protein
MYVLTALQKFFLTALILFSHGLMPAMNGQDRVSRNNYTGDWESPSSWDPLWQNPQTTYQGINATIHGYITVNGPLTLFGNPTQLIVNDTLVVKGDLTLGNNNYLTVNDNAILIIWGDLLFHDQSHITGNGYVIITGNIVKTGRNFNGSFTGNDNPLKLFVGESVPNETDGHPDYPSLSCTDPPTEPYPNTGCSYGNMDDLMNDPVFDFFQSTCLVVNISGTTPVCSGSTIGLSVPEGIAWEWIGPAGFTSEEQYSSIPGADTGMTGTYTVMVTAASGCTVRAAVEVLVNPEPLVVINDHIPLCEPETADLTEEAITRGSDPDLAWSWHPDAGSADEMEAPRQAGAGTYYIRGTTIHGCYNVKPVTVTVNPLPSVTIISSDNPLCAGDKRELSGVPAGGIFSVKDGPGNISGSMLTASGAGYINLEYLYSDGCENRALQTLPSYDYPVPDPGPDQELGFIFNTRMQASLMPFETGKWSLVSGSGKIRNSNSPVTEITSLAPGENKFLWTVQNRGCIAEAEVRIIVGDLFVPSVITPNEDGKNDFFQISEVEGPVELTIFNRWGIEEYRNTNYRNTWDGRNKNGVMLPDDTYFYILRFNNGMTRQGTVLIKRR